MPLVCKECKGLFVYVLWKTVGIKCFTCDVHSVFWQRAALGFASRQAEFTDSEKRVGSHFLHCAFADAPLNFGSAYQKSWVPFIFYFSSKEAGIFLKAKPSKWNGDLRLFYIAFCVVWKKYLMSLHQLSIWKMETVFHVLKEVYMNGSIVVLQPLDIMKEFIQKGGWISGSCYLAIKFSG